jgi:hypothetical protein
MPVPVQDPRGKYLATGAGALVLVGQTAMPESRHGKVELHVDVRPTLPTGPISLVPDSPPSGHS